jgi:putative transposase
MKSNIPSLQTETFYHIYNRGINGENIFKKPKNYTYFLSKYANLISSVADTYAYSLLKNQFHILIKTRSETEILQTLAKKKAINSSTAISLQFSHLFNGYAQGFNKEYSRTGSLFETPFRRIEISDNNYLRQLIFYIHFNAEKHGLCADFRKYTFCSYQAFLSNKLTRLKKDEVLNWFGDKTEFIKFHSDLSNLSDDSLEFE